MLRVAAKLFHRELSSRNSINMNLPVIGAVWLIALPLWSTPAHAVARYELQGVIASRPFPSSFSEYPASFKLEFRVSDAAVERGSFSIKSLYGNDAGLPPGYAGDVADFVSLSVVADTVTPARLRGRVEDFTVAFGPDQGVTSFRLMYFGDVAEARLSSSDGNLIGGSFGSEPSCSSNPFRNIRCVVAGRVEVAEPVSLALLGVGLAGLAAARYRSAARRLQ